MAPADDEVLAGEEAGVDGEIERATRTGVELHVTLLEAELVAEDLDGLGLELAVVTAAFVADLGDGFAGGNGGAEGVLVGADDDGERIDGALTEVATTTITTGAAALLTRDAGSGSGLLDRCEGREGRGGHGGGAKGAHKIPAREAGLEIEIVGIAHG